MRSNNILPFDEEKGIMLVSATPRGYLPTLPGENFCRQARKRRVTTFVMRARIRGSTDQSACEGWL